jgi:phosphoserine phosphatase
MFTPRKARVRSAITLLLFICLLPSARAQNDPLPSWNNTTPRQTIIDFVRRVTRQGSPDFVPVDQRIAAFDNDGTLWVEQPMYTELAFVLQRIHQLAPKHPTWKATQPFKGVLEGDIKAVAASGDKGAMQLLAAAETNMSVDEFHKIVLDWLATAQHPRFKRPYTQCVYQPMLELLTYLRANGFKTFIVSGGSVEFMRPWTEQVYGVPPEQVVGTTVKTKFETLNGQADLLRLPEVTFVDDKEGKPVGISTNIGRRPIAAFGNSDGDLQMLQYTTAGPGPRLALLVHHTDAAREYAYDRKSSMGRLDKALDEAEAKGWIVVDMKNDWKTIFPPQH